MLTKVNVRFRRTLITGRGFIIEREFDGNGKWERWSNPNKYRNKTDAINLVDRLVAAYEEWNKD